MEDVRTLFVADGFEPDTWQLRAGVLEVSGVVRVASVSRFKALVVARPEGPVPSRVSFGIGWIRPAPSAARQRDFEQALQPILVRLASREREILGWFSRRTAGHNIIEWEFSKEETDRPFRRDQMDALSDPATGEVRLGLFLRSACVQQCRFCPPKSRTTAGPSEWESDLEFVRRLAEEVFKVARRRGIPVTVTLKADDLLAHGRLPEILRIIHTDSGCPIHLVTPVNRIRDASDALRAASLPGVESLAFTLFGASAEVHDFIAGRPGAFSETLRAARWLSRAGAIETRLRFVVTRQGLDDLPGVLRTAIALGASFTIAGLVADTPEHRRTLVGLLPRLDHLQRALEDASDAILASRAEIVDLPLCALPASLRDHARSRRARDRPLWDYEFPDACARCEVRDDCIGVPRAYRTDFGEEGLVPVAPTSLR